MAASISINYLRKSYEAQDCASKRMTTSLSVAISVWYGTTNLKSAIGHCAPSLIQGRLNPTYKTDRLTEYFEYVRETVRFKHWYFGHYHEDVDFDDGFSCLLDRVLSLESCFRTL